MRNRAITFKNKAESKEQEEAWDEVISWFDSFLKPEYRILTNYGAIGLPFGFRRLKEVFEEQSEGDKKSGRNRNERRRNIRTM